MRGDRLCLALPARYARGCVMTTPLLPGFGVPSRSMSQPYASSSATSKAGATRAESIHVRMTRELEGLYLALGPLSDAEAAYQMSRIYGRPVERTTIIPRRTALVREGIVEAKGPKVNPVTNVQNMRWGLR